MRHRAPRRVSSRSCSGDPPSCGISTSGVVDAARCPDTGGGLGPFHRLLLGRPPPARSPELVPGGRGRSGQGERSGADRSAPRRDALHRPDRARRRRRRRPGRLGPADQASAARVHRLPVRRPRSDPDLRHRGLAARGPPAQRRGPALLLGQPRPAARGRHGHLGLRHRRHLHRAAAPPGRKRRPLGARRHRGGAPPGQPGQGARRIQRCPSSSSSGCPPASASRRAASPARWPSEASSPGSPWAGAASAWGCARWCPGGSWCSTTARRSRTCPRPWPTGCWPCPWSTWAT